MPRRAVLSDGDQIEFEVFGDKGPFVFLGPQLYLEPIAPQFDGLTPQYVGALKDRYRVIVANWPRGVGNSSPPKAHTLQRDHAIKDVHAVADAAGADRFAWWGYSFGAAVGLQLARSNPRISAFVCGGFPPLWQPLSDMLGVVRGMARPDNIAAMRQTISGQLKDVAGIGAQSIAFYESVAGNDDWKAADEITCPRLVLHDVDDAVTFLGLKTDLAMRTRAAEVDLKAKGWEIAWIETGQGHMAMADAKACLGAFAPFLDRALLGR